MGSDPKSYTGFLDYGALGVAMAFVLVIILLILVPIMRGWIRERREDRQERAALTKDYHDFVVTQAAAVTTAIVEARDSMGSLARTCDRNCTAQVNGMDKVREGLELVCRRLNGGEK